MSSSQPEDSDNTPRKQHQRRRNPLPGAIIAACYGLIAFAGVAGNPRFQTIHMLDVIRLMTAGASIPIVIMLLIRFFNSPGSSSKAEKDREQGTS